MKSINTIQQQPYQHAGRLARLAIMLPCCIALTGLAQSVQAATWSSSADITVSANYSDNILLADDNEVDNPDDKDGAQTRQALALLAKRIARTVDYSIGANLEFVQYFATEQQVQDQENGAVNFALQYRPNKKIHYDFAAGYNRDTRTGEIRDLSQLRDSGTETPPIDTGDFERAQVREQIRFDKTNARGAATWQLSRRLDASVGASFDNIEYDDTAAAITADNFQDYKDTKISLNVDYALSLAGDSLNLGIAQTTYKSSSDTNVRDSVRYPIHLSYQRALSSGFRLIAMAGLVRTEFDFDGATTTDPTYRLAVTGRGSSKLRYTLGAVQNIWPGAAGDLRQGRQAYFSVITEAKRRQDMELSALFGETTAIDDSTSQEKQTYFTAEAKYSWHLARNLTFAMKYSYHNRDGANNTTTTDANTLSASFNLKLR